MRIPLFEELGELPGGGGAWPAGDVAVLGDQVLGVLPLPSRDHDGCGAGLDGAVAEHVVPEGEVLPAVPPVPGEQLRGVGGGFPPNEEETLAGDHRGVGLPVVQGLSPELPARRGELVTAGPLTHYQLVLPTVQGNMGHARHEGWQGAVQLPGGWSPELSRVAGTSVLAASYS